MFYKLQYPKTAFGSPFANNLLALIYLDKY